MTEFLKAQFDKLLLSSLLIFMVLIVLHIAHDKGDSGLVNWAREMVAGLMGALLGLITGKMLAGNATGVSNTTVDHSTVNVTGPTGAPKITEQK